ncbi:competence type IV pilus minor pilin ComGG [Neobacillus sp. D3-1R]|uniref:competence type IV pilus minor pilin ComGG n=1 Tax=Neobacillus sp. D3-1R TaxID=3445778 RepID=UPI003FA0D3C6
MKNNQNGLTYPIVLMVAILFFSFLVYQMQFYLSEKQLHHETEIILKQEYYLHLAVKKVEEGLNHNSILIGSGQFTFKKGSVVYKVESYSTSLLRINFTVKLNTLEEAVGIGYYDKTKKIMIKWIEKN